jgi:hypothetical protein
VRNWQRLSGRIAHDCSGEALPLDRLRAEEQLYASVRCMALTSLNTTFIDTKY